MYFIESITQPEAYECFNIQSIDTWATPIKEFLKTRVEPLEEIEAKRMRRIALNYTFIDGILYKNGFSTLYVRCVAKPETTTILTELHEVYDTFHEGAKSIVRKVFNQGYY